MTKIAQIKPKKMSNGGLPGGSGGDNINNTHTSKSSVIDGFPFIEQLRSERHRAQRSGNALSILLIKQNVPNISGSETIRQILKIVRTKVRETDIVGYVDKNTIGVLLPYTDEIGATRSADKIMSCFINPRFTISVSTYPDEIFESLAKNGGVTPDVMDLMLADSYHYSWAALKAKRLMDIVGSICALLMFSPVMITTALLIRFGSKGPVIFKQTRLGQKGVPFTFYKFRSMYVNSDDQIHREYVSKLIHGGDSTINNGDQDTPLFKMTADPRITPIGRFIRKTSVDELPQFYNVLKGDMSLVGPRPPIAYEAEEYQSWHLRRILEMKPGITGLWQVEGRSRTEFDDAVRLDVRYLQKWSLLLDVKILLKTVKEVLACRGAY